MGHSSLRPELVGEVEAGVDPWATIDREAQSLQRRVHPHADPHAAVRLDKGEGVLVGHIVADVQRRHRTRVGTARALPARLLLGVALACLTLAVTGITPSWVAVGALAAVPVVLRRDREANRIPAPLALLAAAAAQRGSPLRCRDKEPACPMWYALAVAAPLIPDPTPFPAAIVVAAVAIRF